MSGTYDSNDLGTSYTISSADTPHYGIDSLGPLNVQVNYPPLLANTATADNQNVGSTWQEPTYFYLWEAKKRIAKVAPQNASNTNAVYVVHSGVDWNQLCDLQMSSPLHMEWAMVARIS